MARNQRVIDFPQLRFESSLLGYGCSLDRPCSVLSNIEDPDWESAAARYRFKGTRCVEALPTTGHAVYWEMEVRIQHQDSLPQEGEVFCTVGVATDVALRSCSRLEGFVVTDQPHRRGVTTVLGVHGSCIWGLSRFGKRRVSHGEVVECQPAGLAQTIDVQLGFLWDPKTRRIFVINVKTLNPLVQASVQVGGRLFFAGEVESLVNCNATVTMRLRTDVALIESISTRTLRYLRVLLDTCQ